MISRKRKCDYCHQYVTSYNWYNHPEHCRVQRVIVKFAANDYSTRVTTKEYRIVRDKVVNELLQQIKEVNISREQVFVILEEIAEGVAMADWDSLTKSE